MVSEGGGEGGGDFEASSEDSDDLMWFFFLGHGWSVGRSLVSSVIWGENSFFLFLLTWI